jgi:hypothetical protein
MLVAASLEEANGSGNDVEMLARVREARALSRFVGNARRTCSKTTCKKCYRSEVPAQSYLYISGSSNSRDGNDVRGRSDVTQRNCLFWSEDGSVKILQSAAHHLQLEYRFPGQFSRLE